MAIEFPANAQRYWLVNATVPLALMPAEKGTRHAPGEGRRHLLIEDGRISRILSDPVPDDGAPRVELAGRMVLPRFVDVHTHLDKGHIFARAPNPDGSFLGALTTVMEDRSKNWSAADVRTRMDFALRCAFHHGTGAIRTHLDSRIGQSSITWPVFDEMRAEWKDRITLQAVSIFPTMFAVEQEEEFRDMLDHVGRYSGILGGVTFLGQPLDAAFDLALDRTFDAAKAHGFDLDFHVDESASEDARSLERIADAALKHKFKGKILAGHCCSLALMADADRARVIDKLGEAGIAIVSLPMCNLYLQDRQSGRTPRWRGVAPLHELDTVGISTMVASDNTRDPFYAYGDLDGLEVFREATRILHLDHTARPWIETLTTRPAAQMRLEAAGTITIGMPADLIILAARTVNEMNSRPQSDRTVLIDGKVLRSALPDYAELDSLTS